jgi:hypothetical protein
VGRPTVSQVRESVIEGFFDTQVRKQGGVTYKFTSPSRRGVPDRLVLWPGGQAEFVELKAPGKKLNPIQEREHARLRALEFRVTVIDSLKGVDMWLYYHPFTKLEWVDRLPKC